MFFDSQKPISDERNQKILLFLKALKFVNDAEKDEEIEKLQKEIESSVHS